TFIQISPYVVQFSWGSEKIQQEDRIYFTAYASKTGDQGKLSLWTTEVDFKSVDVGAKGRPGAPVLSLKHGNKFMISNEFILVAKVSSEEKQTVNLMVSSDGASSWKAALLPSGMGELEEKWYTIVDTSEGAILLHLNSDGEAARDTGRIFVSDSNGYKYSQSLLHNVRSSQGEVEFDKGLKERPLKGHSGSTLQAMDTADPGYEMARQGMVSYLFSQAKQSASEAAEQAASQGYKESTPTADARSCSWLVIAGKQRVGALFVCQFPFQRSVVSALWNDGCFSASGGERCWGDRLRWFGRAWFQLFFHELPG
ncbi:SORT1, partial [Symbiodinium microadriaticum]